MQAVRKLTTFVEKAFQRICQRAVHSTNKLTQCITKAAIKNKPKTKVVYNYEPASPVEAISTVNSLSIKFKNGSRFTNRNLDQSKIDQIAEYRQNKLKQLEHERERIQRSIRAVDNQITNLRLNHKDTAYQRRLDISQDTVAYSQAQMLVHRLSAQKKIVEQRKQLKERLRLVEQERAERLKVQEQQLQKQRVLQERRLSIAKRLCLQGKRRQEMKQLNSMSNQLIKQIKKLNPAKPITEPSQPVTKRKQVDLLVEINEHSKKYMQFRQKLSEKSVQQKPTITPQKYYKGKINRLLQEEDKEKKKQNQQKHEQPYIQLQKRKKYGQLVKTLINVNKNSLTKPPTASMDISHGASHDVSRDRKQLNYTNIKRISTEEQMELPKKRRRLLTDQEMIIRQRQLRKENRIKMKQLIQMEELEKSKVSKPTPLSEKYKDYLKQLPKLKPNDRDMVKRIMQDKSLSKEDKYVQVMNKASLLEYRAKIKEETLKNVTENDEVVGLIVSSIQAKLALLDSL